MEKKIRITTVDNPYDPFKQFEEWLVYDHTKGYHTNQRLASITYTSDQLTDEENYEAIETGIDELVKYGAINKLGENVAYKKVIKQK